MVGSFPHFSCPQLLGCFSVSPEHQPEGQSSDWLLFGPSPELSSGLPWRPAACTLFSLLPGRRCKAEADQILDTAKHCLASPHHLQCSWITSLWQGWRERPRGPPPSPAVRLGICQGCPVHVLLLLSDSPVLQILLIQPGFNFLCGSFKTRFRLTDVG